LLKAVKDGHIDPAKFQDHFDMWNFWKSIGTTDEEAPV
jgi:hypothetical protein